MRLMIRTLMFFACLLYGAMPAQMALGMPAMSGIGASSQAAMSHDAVHYSHSRDRSPQAASDHPDLDTVQRSIMGDCCPHGDDAKHTGSCAACLIVVPQTVFADAGRMIFAYPKPQRGTVFNGKAFAPPLPPPRA